MKTDLCPSCGSGKIETVSGILGLGKCRCSKCGWEGNKKDLIAISLETVMRRKGEINDSDVALTAAKEIASDYFVRLAQQAAFPIGKCIVDAGLVASSQKLVLTRLLKAACVGAFRATLEELEKVQKEFHDARPE